MKSLKALLIAEKPSLMLDIQKVYNKYGHKDVIHFTTFVGHTMMLKEPGDYKKEWEDWNLDVLPMIPDVFEYKPSSDKLKMYKEISEKIKKGNYDYLINACDPGREGQHIFFSFYDSLGIKIPVKRMWHSDLTEQELKRALDNLRDEREPSLRNMTIASKYRAYFDWLIGMNGTRAVRILSKSKEKFSVGRVMTPVLNIIVQRELELRNFVPKPYWEIEGDFSQYKGTYFDHNNENETKFFSKEKAEALMKQFGTHGTVVQVSKKKETKYAPALHSLQELSNEANRTYGYTMAETLKIAQSLYEKKILSYPRTDSQYITSAIAKEFGTYLKSVACIPELKNRANQVMNNPTLMNEVAKNKKYVDDKKVSDHYAIIPTGVTVDVSNLSEKERNIFTLVCKRFLAIFMPPMITNKTNIVTESNGHLFHTNGSVLIDLGYMSLYNYKANNTVVPDLKKGDVFELQTVNLVEKKTTPPARYTDETLGKVMENVGRLVEDEELSNVLKEANGLGTPATRGAIVEKLVDLKMIERKRKSFYATDFGISIIQSLEGKDITLPELTAIWEQKLSGIEKGTYNPNDFYREMIEYVKEMVEDYKHTKLSIMSSEKEVIGICPKCSGNVIEGKSYYLCQHYKKSCDFLLPKEYHGAKLTKTEIKKLLKGKETKEYEFAWKSGKKGKTSLVLGKDFKISFAFMNPSNTNESTQKVIGKCPKCGGDVVEETSYVHCIHYKTSCDFHLSKIIKGGKITTKNMKLLLAGKPTDEIEFVWSSGKKGKARLQWKDNKINFLFNNR